MIRNLWYTIKAWFNDRNDRSNLLYDFNKSANMAFINGVVPTLLKAKFSKGHRAYKHQFSDWFSSGFRIEAFAGKQLSKNELIQIGDVVLNDNILVRKLIVLGFDTLEVHSDKGNYGCRWQLRDFIKIG